MLSFLAVSKLLAKLFSPAHMYKGVRPSLLQKSMQTRILYIAPAFPILTCTFIYREIFDLRNMGFVVDTVSMNTPPPDRVSEEAKGFLETTLFLDQVPETRKFAAFIKCLVLRPGVMFRCLRIFCSAAPMKSFRDYRRLGYHLIEACYLAEKLKNQKPDHMHSHFITGATSINMFLSELIDVPFSFTMHASAIWIDPIALETKLRRCRFCVSISQFNKNYVLETYGREWEDKINIVHCGISLEDLEQLPDHVHEHVDPVRVLAVGQLMKRKGYHVLVEAAANLRDRRVPVSWTIVGEGPERAVLEKMISQHGLEGVIQLAGAKPHEEIAKFAAKADIFTLPCVIGDDNTRDGIPVALMEAMAWKLPVVSTNIVGLPELIESGKDGLLVESGSAAALAEGIQRLAASPELRRQLGEAAYSKIEREFNSRRSAERLAQLFASA